jgi:LL-diaminopimelate aminotransferase
LPLLAQNGFLPDLDSIDREVCKRAKVLWINYPNNPTGASADLDFLQRAVEFAHQNEVLLCADCAYSEIAFDGYQVPSVLQVPGAREVAVEFHSMSKSYNMTGWRIGFAAGQARAVQALGDLKNNLDSGAFTAVQVAAIQAMALWPEPCRAMSDVYQGRRDVLVDGLRGIGFKVDKPQGGFFVWMPVPGGDDRAFAAKLIEQAGVLVAPGSGFGDSGKGYIRFALTVPEPRLAEAVERIGRMG